MMMIISDIFIASSLTYLALVLFIFLVAAFNNRGRHGFGSIEHDHFVEHAVAGGLGFVGCVIGVICAVVHLILQNTGNHFVPPDVEIIENVSRGVLLISASMFVHHMIREESPHHPFYYLHFPMGVKHK